MLLDINQLLLEIEIMLKVIKIKQLDLIIILVEIKMYYKVIRIIYLVLKIQFQDKKIK